MRIIRMSEDRKQKGNAEKKVFHCDEVIMIIVFAANIIKFVIMREFCVVKIKYALCDIALLQNVS